VAREAGAVVLASRAAPAPVPARDRRRAGERQEGVAARLLEEMTAPLPMTARGTFAFTSRDDRGRAAGAAQASTQAQTPTPRSSTESVRS